MNKRKRKLSVTGSLTVLLLVFLLLPLQCLAVGRLQDPGDEIVVVIDPGHGGLDSGTAAFEPLEKVRNLSVAITMANELAQYEGVKVYLSRTADVGMTLKDRAAFAASVNADLLISLHFNACNDHSQFGAEAWIPCAAPNNAYAYQFADIWTKEMESLGIYNRGSKVRINGLGRDYYGIIREAAYYGIPAVIVEHCYLDNAADRQWCDDDMDMVTFGKKDAAAVAKYFGLHSNTLGTDYRDYTLCGADPAGQYGKVHTDPNAKEGTPPGPLAEGAVNPEAVELGLVAAPTPSPAAVSAEADPVTPTPAGTAAVSPAEEPASDMPDDFAQPAGSGSENAAEEQDGVSENAPAAEKEAESVSANIPARQITLAAAEPTQEQKEAAVSSPAPSDGKDADTEERKENGTFLFGLIVAVLLLGGMLAVGFIHLDIRKKEKEMLDKLDKK